MIRAAWAFLALVTVAFSVWFGAAAPMADIDLGCAKVAESPGAYRCDDPVRDVVGAWPLIGLGLLLTAPPAVAAAAGRVWVSWLAVVMMGALAIIGLASWTGFWGTLLFAFPLAAVGALLTAVQHARRRPRGP